MKCLICNIENQNNICEKCIKNEPKEIINIIRMLPNIEYEEYIKIVEDITKDLTSPIKEYCIIMSNIKRFYNVSKINREYILNNKDICLNSELLSKDEKNILRTLLLDIYYKIYQYEKAEEIANELLNEELNEISLYSLGEYYIYTRRYEIAERLLTDGIVICKDNYMFEKLYEKITECKERKDKIKTQYMPSTIENKNSYIKFMKSIGIEINITINKQPPNKELENYPEPKEYKEAGFKSFVAFDLETTGINHNYDSITEIAAIRVINGEIVETKEFVFQELVHPYKKRIPKLVEEKTGITNEMVAEAREVWEVFEDFANFIKEDDILVGYNCMSFDSKLLTKAGKISNIIIKNKYFDVMNYVKKFKYKLNYTNKTLTSIGETLNIINPNAHRALADAVTTAKVYLKLLEIDN